jgi:hypothetical protein
LKRTWMLPCLLISLLIGVACSRSWAAPGIRVTGGGQYFSPLIGLTYVKVNAIQHPDGSVSGQFEQHGPEVRELFGETPGQVSGHGTVTCLYLVDDHTAVVSGFITDVHNLPDALSFIQPGSPFVLLVQDNGNGNSGGPDLTGPFLTDLPGGTFSCSDPDVLAALLPVLVPLKSGNFQVTP